MGDEKTLAVLQEILNWTRAASFAPVKALLKEALADAKAKSAYQMLDGTKTLEQVRITCKMSPNGLGALAQKWVSMGLMEVKDDKRRVRLFNLEDFDLES